jgi:hypothetical protein
MAETEFESFPSIRRLTRECVVTEKIDGCNVQVVFPEDGSATLVGSRNRWIVPGKTTDQFGFAQWVKDHEEELRTGLGLGKHFGEWWGAGIQRKYGLKEKRFSLFNVRRWGDDPEIRDPLATPRPACCSAVPVLWKGTFDTVQIDVVLSELKRNGSVAAPGFMDPEGIVVFHTAASVLFKKTLDGDGHKGAGKGE